MLGIIGLILIFVFLDDVKDTLGDEGVDTTTFFIVFAVAYGVSTGTAPPHMGADFFPEGGKNTSKFVVPPKWL